MTTAVLAGEGLEKSFGGLRVLTGVSFRVAPAEIVALIGPNGAGKTTLFNLVSGLDPVRRAHSRRRDGHHPPPPRRRYMLALGLVLIAVVLVLPNGLVDLRRRVRRA